MSKHFQLLELGQNQQTQGVFELNFGAVEAEEGGELELRLEYWDLAAGAVEAAVMWMWFLMQIY
jgi:hypothetical protein